jgi:DNA-binding GntR family transcriptional regulator
MKASRIKEQRRVPVGRRNIPASNISLAERVYQAFKRDIIAGVHKPGEALSENILGRRYSTSRTPVREAAVRLERENLVRIVPKKGYFVKLIGVSELNELYEYRAMLECAAAELASSKEPDPNILEELKISASVCYQPGNRSSYSRFIEADTAFHVGIARLTGNQLLISAVSDLRAHIEQILYATINLGDYCEVLTREHSEIYKAIRERDSRAAHKLMLEHVMGSREKILGLL